MNVAHLVRMANDIGHFFAAEPDPAVGAAGIAQHMQRYWEPRMRRAIIQYLDTDGSGLEALVREAVVQLREASRTRETSAT